MAASQRHINRGRKCRKPAVSLRRNALPSDPETPTARNSGLAPGVRNRCSFEAPDEAPLNASGRPVVPKWPVTAISAKKLPIEFLELAPETRVSFEA